MIVMSGILSKLYVWLLGICMRSSTPRKLQHHHVTWMPFPFLHSYRG